jgi:hypothetical protein
MDDIVRQAMAKWPNVPDCYGWLGLDARGNWYMRDDRAQAAGAFDSERPGAKGSLLKHDKLIDFIQRNYEQNAQGHWYFQNGPQRVYVELEATPWIWRIEMDGSVRAHSGEHVTVQRCVLDEQGRVYLLTERGLGLVHTQDVGRVAEQVEAGRWVPEQETQAELPDRYGYVRSPQRDRADKSGSP